MTNLRKICTTSDEDKEVTNMVAKYIAMDCLPINTVKKRGFNMLMNYCFKSKYQMPGYNHFTDTKLPRLYNEIAGAIKKDFENRLCLYNYRYVVVYLSLSLTFIHCSLCHYWQYVEYEACWHKVRPLVHTMLWSCTTQWYQLCVKPRCYWKSFIQM